MPEYMNTLDIHICYGKLALDITHNTIISVVGVQSIDPFSLYVEID